MIDQTVPAITTHTIYMPSHIAAAMLGSNCDLPAHDAAADPALTTAGRTRAVER